jgi:hypothetical protein
MKDYKQFSREDYDDNDPIAKVIASKFMLWDGRFAFDVPLEEQEEYFKQRDFFLRQIATDAMIGVETERKIDGWSVSGKWARWDTVDIPFRKKDSKAQIHIMHNKHWNTIAVSLMKNVMAKSEASNGENNYKYFGRKNTKITKNEPFFRVPLQYFRFFKVLNEDKTEWVEISKDGDLIGE